MKKISLFLICIFLITMTACYKAPVHDITVYKTSAGAKYHKDTCRYVKGKAIETNLSRAIYDGYEACKVCHPSTQEDLDKLNK